MSSTKNLRSIQRQIERYSLGDFSGRIRFHGGDDQWDAVSVSLNMLGEELREITVSKELFLNIFNAIPDMLLITDYAGKVLIANYAANKVTGINAGQRFDDYFKGAGGESFLQLRKSFTEADSGHERALKRPNMPDRFFSGTFSEMEAELRSGRYIALIKDVTEREQATRQIAASEQKFRELFDSSSDGILLIDAGGKVLHMNDSAAALVLRPKDALLTVHDILRIAGSTNFSKHHLAQLLKGVANMEVRVHDAKGQSHVCLLSSVPARSTSGPEACQLLIKNISQYRAYNKQLFQAVNERQEHERQRIANDLHDSIGQHLSSLKFMLSAARKSVTDDAANEMLGDISASVSQVIDELRAISFDLMPGTLHHFGLLRTIDELLERMRVVHPHIEFSFESPREIPELAEDVKLHCYRMVQEFIANSMKHAAPRSVAMRMSLRAGYLLQLQLVDDGKGFNLRTALRGTTRGLQNIISRTDSCGGHVRMKSVIGEGTSVIITIPIG